MTVEPLDVRSDRWSFEWSEAPEWQSRFRIEVRYIGVTRRWIARVVERDGHGEHEDAYHEIVRRDDRLGPTLRRFRTRWGAVRVARRECRRRWQQYQDGLGDTGWREVPLGGMR